MTRAAGTAELTADAVGDVAVVRIKGEIDLANTEAVARGLTEALENAGGRLVIDLSDVSFLDSAGLRMLLQLGTPADRDGRRLHLVAGEGSFASHLFEMSRVGDLIPVHRAVSEAVAAP